MTWWKNWCGDFLCVRYLNHICTSAKFQHNFMFSINRWIDLIIKNSALLLFQPIQLCHDGLTAAHTLPPCMEESGGACSRSRRTLYKVVCNSSMRRSRAKVTDNTWPRTSWKLKLRRHHALVQTIVAPIILGGEATFSVLVIVLVPGWAMLVGVLEGGGRVARQGRITGGTSLLRSLDLWLAARFDDTLKMRSS